MAESGRELESTQDAEKRLGRLVSRALPAATVAIALVVSLVVGLGPTLLVLAAGTLIGTIALLWSSLRTLSGEAPLAESFAFAPTRTANRSVEADERKRTLLRALKDLELEHAVGKIDDEDYAALTSRFRSEAKALMRQMDGATEPLRARAEALAREYLASKGLAQAAGADGANDAAPVIATPLDSEGAVDAGTLRSRHADSSVPSRRLCDRCHASNDADAAFCKKCGHRLTPEDDSDAPAD